MKITIYKEVAATFDSPEIEHNVLSFWKKTDAFKTLVTMNRGKKRWSFIDGPITANNPMGVHHAWGRTYKDLYQRYKAMNGFDLRYQNGFDCQGLWVEVEVEKGLGFKSKNDIEKYGIAEFVNKCKQRVLKYASIQVEQSIRLGYWMNWDDTTLLRKLSAHIETPEKILSVKTPKGDFTDSVELLVSRLGTSPLNGSYFTFSNENNYTIWTALKKCNEHGWIYKGRDVMPWCPRCSTALSQHEIATDGYRDLTHPGLIIRLPLYEKPNESLLVWTTTPWTLTSNVAAAVNPDLLYVKILYQGEIFYLAKSALATILSKEYEILEEFMGQAMEGWTYVGPYDDLPINEKMGVMQAHRVILWEDVSEAEGTGIVHIAPGCGKEDFELSKMNKLPVIAPLDDLGIFIEGFSWLTGIQVYDSAKPIIEDLKKKDLLFKMESYTHRYPVCWRCGNELVFRLVNEWFISMGEKLKKPVEKITDDEKRKNLRYQIMDVTQKIRWIPAFGLQQELDWLQNMDDWMISKKRYWGLALPIWECKNCGTFDVIGSEKELQSRAVEGWEDFKGHTPHRPWIDAVKIKCPKCGTPVSRITDVGNPWLDAGIVAYSTLNYLHDSEYWARWFPAHFICESLSGQFRNWFYSMLAMSTIMTQRTPFLTCLGHGSVFAEDGREMHKSWGNAIWFDDAIDTIGADVMRWMYCKTRPESNMFFGYSRADSVKRQFLIPLWNIYSFFVTYANLDTWTPKKMTDQLSLLDRWILSKLQILIQDVTDYLENFDAFKATAHLQQFVGELSTWYIRRSRRRFWKSKADVDKNAAYTTLYTSLITLTKLLAPFIPFLTEEMYQNLVSTVQPESLVSVHHNNWPVADPSLIDLELMADMDEVINVSSLGRSARSKSGIKLRQPLMEAIVVSDETILTRLRRLITLIAEELNVKKVTLLTHETVIVDYEVHLLPNVLGKKYGPLFPKLQIAVKGLDANAMALPFLNGLTVDVEVEDHIITLLPEEVEIKKLPKNGWMFVETQGLLVGVNLIITEDLKKQGLAQDIVRRIQNQRKDAGFDIADQIETYYDAGSKLTDIFETYGNHIAAETLSTTIYKTEPPKNAHIKEFKLDDMPLKIGLIRVKGKDEE
ncbi:isoleucine--tRNA ligase [Candidatus Bathyarchaeota archaeon]|nr:isoleucine--tRNA ligase [Candidatus Bathyarchaeota archaeon]